MRVMLHAGATGHDSPVMRTLLGAASAVCDEEAQLGQEPPLRADQGVAAEPPANKPIEIRDDACLSCVWSAFLHQHTFCCILLSAKTVQKFTRHGHIQIDMSAAF